MSWRLMLSEYPDSLLTDDLALILLVLLERGGLVTESEIQKELNVEMPKIIKKLLALHRNRCIEYLRNYIKLTERGKQLVDRFSLNDALVDNLLNRLPISADRRPSFKDAIVQFRHDSFEEYLIAVAAVNSWATVSELPYLAENVEDNNLGVGSLAILYRDMQRSFSKKSALLNVAAHRTPVLLILDGFDSLSTDNSALRAIEWANFQGELAKSESPWEIICSMKSIELGLFSAFEECRSDWQTTDWLDEWTGAGKILITLRACETGLEALDKISKIGETDWKTLLQIPNERRLTRYYDKTGKYESPGIMSDFLLNLFSVRSFDELVKTTRSDRDFLANLLRQIQEKCDSLLRGQDTEKR